MTCRRVPRMDSKPGQLQWGHSLCTWKKKGLLWQFSNGIVEHGGVNLERQIVLFSFESVPQNYTVHLLKPFNCVFPYFSLFHTITNQMFSIVFFFTTNKILQDVMCWSKKYLQWEISWKRNDFSRTWQQRQTQDLKWTLENCNTHKKITCIRTELLSILLYIASHLPFFKHTLALTADYHARGLVCPSGAFWGSFTRTLWYMDGKRLNQHPCDRWTTCSASWATAAQRRHYSHDPLKHDSISFVEWFQMKQLIWSL